jgi:cell division protein FtsW
MASQKTEISTGKPDYGLIVVVGLLVLLGLTMLAGVSAAISQEKFGTPNFYLFHQLLYGLLPGIILGFLVYRMKLDKLKKWAPLLLLGNLFLMLLVFVPKIGMTLGGSRSWLNLGVITFQPSELLKLTLIIYLSSWLAARTEKKEHKATFVAFSAIIGLVAALLILQPDIGTLGIIALTGILTYFLSGTPVRHTLLIIILAVIVLTLAIRVSPHAFSRLSVFLNPELDPMGQGYQLRQVSIAVGSGGFFGKGWGMSIQKFGLVPQPLADSIFAIISEEGGLVISLTFVTLFLLLAWRGAAIFKQTQDKFRQLMAAGISSWLIIQAFVNIGAMLGLCPITGIPLPLISYGGSALAVELIAVGLLLNISKTK